MIENFKTITTTAEGFYKEKGSKFLAFAIPCTKKKHAKQEIEALRKKHPNACHVCFAWRFGTENFEDRYSDDGEPNNSAGKPIFGQILSFEITNVLIAIVRYYGGTNLGVGGLVTAYKTAAKESLENSKIITKEIQNYYILNYEYSITGEVMGILNRAGAEITKQGFDGKKPTINFQIPVKTKNTLEGELENCQHVEYELLKTL